MINENEQFKAIAERKHDTPFSFLGCHHISDDSFIIRAYFDNIKSVDLLDLNTNKKTRMVVHKDYANCFYITIQSNQRPSYIFEVKNHENVISTHYDVHNMPTLLGELDILLLTEGRHYESYKVLGSQKREITLGDNHKVAGVNFCVWAPNARLVSVVGDFNDWNSKAHIMKKHYTCGIWEIFIPNVENTAHYKYEIIGNNGTKLPLKSDPYAFYNQQAPNNASRVWYDDYKWQDEKWLKSRHKYHDPAKPMSIYEVHLGSWKMNADGSWLNYREMAQQIIQYVKEMDYTHLEIMPITEYPYGGSWGYQTTGMFAVTSRYGTPEDFKYFVDLAHKNDLSVILDWVPGHFPSDSHGLAEFDGSCLYEHSDPRKGKQEQWGTLIYNYERREVANFLISSALFWLTEFHIDGLRVDAVASMLYLDYGANKNNWVPNEYGTNENIGGINFLKALNAKIEQDHADVYTIAEESTSRPGVTTRTDQGGLGFKYKWNLGWMNDTNKYMTIDSMHRKHHQNLLTFGIVYAFSENFILPLSHDEVVHGKSALIGKMFGDEWQSFANLRAYYGFMFAHPGKKLLFMGSDLGQYSEWNYEKPLEWDLLQYPIHKGLNSMVKDLNKFYQNTPALYEDDFTPNGFEWIDCNDIDNSVVSIIRYNKDHSESIISISNFTPNPLYNYDIGTPIEGEYEEVFNTDDEKYTGGNITNETIEIKKEKYKHFDYTLTLTVPPLATIFIQTKK